MFCLYGVCAAATPPAPLLPLRPVWTLPLNNDLLAPPALAGRFGFFPIAGDRLAAYDIEHGALLWVIDSKALFQPIAGDGLVFVVEPASLVAFQQDTGAVAWRLPFSEPLAVSLGWSRGWLMAATASGEVLAFRAADGGLIWRRTIDGGLRAKPSIDGDRVYLPAAGRIVALRIEDGAPLWERRIGGEPNEILAVGDRLFAGSTDNYLYSFLARNGEIAWRWATGGDVIGLPVIDERSVYFVSFDNVIRALNRRSGVQRWKRALLIRPTRGLLLAGDVLVVSGLTRTALAFSTKDGSPAGDVSASGELAAMPFLVDTEGLPILVMVTRDFSDGTVVSALSRSYEPSSSPINSLPNAVAAPRPPGSSTSGDATAAPSTPASVDRETPPEASPSEPAPARRRRRR